MLNSSWIAVNGKLIELHTNFIAIKKRMLHLSVPAKKLKEFFGGTLFLCQSKLIVESMTG